MAKTWNIYRYDQPTVARATVHDLEYHGSWMEDEYVIVSVRSAEPVDFHYGDHLYYRGTRYDINYDANVIKKARSGSYGEGFTYDSIKLYSIAYRLKDCGFKDVVLNEVYDQANKLVYSSQGKFSFFASSVEDLADRIKANINRFFGSGNTWKVYTPDSSRSSQRNGGAGQWSNYYDTPASYGKTDLNINVEDISCYDALKMAYTEFELSFYLNGQDIVIGGKPITADYDFEYGKGNGLYEIERTSDDSQRIVTKLFAYGSEKNLPLNYYANLHKKAYITGNKIQWQIIEGQTLYSILTGITQTQVSVSAGSIVNVTIGGVTVSASLDFRHGVTGLQPAGTGWSEDYDSPLYLMLNLNTDIKNANAATIFNGYTNGSKIYINNGINLNTWPTVENTASNYPALLSINRLMLPGFPDKSLYEWVMTPEAYGGGGGTHGNPTTGYARWNGYEAYFSTDKDDPWIMSVRSSDIGVREGTANFDEDEDEIYPSIEGTGYDEVDSAEQIADNGYLEGDPSTFTLTPALVSGSDGGIEWNYSEETVSISMKDGYCVGREFQVKGAEKDGETGKWTLTLERQADSSLGNRYFPYKEGDSEDLYQVKQGDKFVILGIPLPKSFVDLASKKLLEEALKHLATIDHQKHTYIPRIDEIEMQRQDDLASQSHGSMVSVHDTICAGMQMQVTDEDLGIDYSPFIDNITIKENGNNGIPTYDVVLKDEKDMTTLERIQSEVRGGTDAVLNALDGVGLGEFLSRINDDTAKGFITFMKGLQVGDRFVSGLLGEGGVFRREEDGTTYIEADKLYIRMKAYFDTVEIRDYRHSSGNRIASSAGMKCIRVVWFDASGNPLEQVSANLSSAVKFRCFFRARDGENEVRNNFVVGDQAYCHITTVETAQDSTDAKGLNMRHYWRLVIGKSSSPDTNGDHWIDLSNVYNSDINTIGGIKYAGFQADSDVPQEQDDIVQLGNVNDATRRGAIIEFVTGADSPSYQIFQGIGDIAGATSLSTKRTRQFSTSGKNYVNLGYATGASSLHGAGHAFLEVMGDFYFGAKPASGETVGNTYIKYDSDNQQLDIKAHVTFLSPTPGGGTEETTFEEFANAIIGDIGDLQDQIDGNIESWFYDYMPVEEDEGAPANTTPIVTRTVSGQKVPVYPYYDWFIADGGDPTTTPVTQPTSTTERLKHLGDTFYDNTSGYAFRFSNTGTAQSPTFAWVIITDSAVVKALQDASDAYDLADNKRRVFLTTPTPPYDEGDLWVNAVWPTSGEVGSVYNNELLKCKYGCSVPREGHTDFSINDWDLATNYGTRLTEFIDGPYNEFKTAIKNQVDKKAETWYQDSDPSDPNSTPHWTDDNANHVGDIWCDTSANGGKKTYIWRDRGEGQSNRFYWAEQAVPDDVFDEIDGKLAIYTSWGAWDVTEGGVITRKLQEKDLLIPQSDIKQKDIEGGTSTTVVYKRNKVYRCTDVGTVSPSVNPTFQEIAYTDDTRVNNFVNEILNGTGATGDDKTVADAIKAVNDALYKNTTTIEGGLILSSLIALKNNGTTYAGISGIYDSSAYGNGIAAWYGGGRQDRYNPQTATFGNTGAKTVFRMDGSGYVASGNISWDAVGNVTIQGYQIKVGQYDVATMNDLSDYVTTNTDQTITGLKTFDSKIKIGDIYIGQDSNGNLEVYKLNGSTHVAANLYATGAVSAFGIGTSGGGGGVTLNQPLDTINNAALGNASQAGQTLVYNGTTWVYSNASSANLSVGKNLSVSGNISTQGIVSGGMFQGAGFKINNSSDDYVLLAGGGTAKLSDIGGGSYLPLSGGTMTGTLTIGTSSLATQLTILRKHDSNGAFIEYSNNSGRLGLLGFSSNGLIARLGTDTNNLTVWHSGNFTPSDYALASSVYSKTEADDKFLYSSGRDSFTPNGTGWYRIGYTSRATMFDFNIWMSNNYGQGHYKYVGSSYASSSWRIIQLYGQYSSSYIPKIRLVYNSSDARAYIEVYYGYSSANRDVHFKFFYGVPSDTVTKTADTPADANESVIKEFAGSNTSDGHVVTDTDLENYVTTSSLTTTLSGYVTLAGNETISGAKTFTQNVTVQQSGTSATKVTAKNDNGTVSLYMDNANRGVYADTLSSWMIYTNGTNTILPIGNVSIGTKSPSSKLDVNGTFNATGNSTIGGTLGVTGAATLSSTLAVTGNTTLGGHLYMSNANCIYWKDSGGTDRRMLYVNSSNNIQFGYDYRSQTSSTFIYGGTGGIELRTNGTTSRMFIDSSGNVSIGSTTASFITEKLNVNGNVRIGDAVLAWDSTNGALKVQKSDGTAANFYATGAVSAFGINSSSSGLSLCTPLSNIDSNISANPTVNGATFVWNNTTSKFVYSSASGQRLYADTMYVDAGGLTVGNSGNLTVGGAATVTGAMTVEMGNLVVTAGRAGIAGATSSSYTLYVHGNIRSNYLAIGATEDVNSVSCTTIKTLSSKGLSVQTGGNLPCYTNVAWSVSSDIRLKNIITNAGASIEQIADAPIFNFRWKSGSQDTILGSSAQYWQAVFPCAVRGDLNSFLSMDYGGVALAAAVITARKVVKHEEEIAALKRKVSELENELNELKAA